MDFTRYRRKIILLFYVVTVACVKISAQFSYSVKAGCSWPSFHNNESTERHVKERPTITFGADVEYHFSHRIGVLTGLNYRRISEKGFLALPGISHPIFDVNASFLEIPLLGTLKLTNSTPKIMDIIVGAGPYVDIKVHQKVDRYSLDFKTYYGIMATIQLEFFSHYFIRGERQWGLASDRELITERRVNMISVVAGYRF